MDTAKIEAIKELGRKAYLRGIKAPAQDKDVMELIVGLPIGAGDMLVWPLHTHVEVHRDIALGARQLRLESGRSITYGRQRPDLQRGPPMGVAAAAIEPVASTAAERQHGQDARGCHPPATGRHRSTRGTAFAGRPQQSQVAAHTQANHLEKN